MIPPSVVASRPRAVRGAAPPPPPLAVRGSRGSPPPSRLSFVVSVGVALPLGGGGVAPLSVGSSMPLPPASGRARVRCGRAPGPCGAAGLSWWLAAARSAPLFLLSPAVVVLLRCCYGGVPMLFLPQVSTSTQAQRNLHCLVDASVAMPHDRRPGRVLTLLSHNENYVFSPGPRLLFSRSTKPALFLTIEGEAGQSCAAPD